MMTTPTSPLSPELPDFSAETSARIEDAVFAAISDEQPRAAAETRASARRRRWVTGAGIAAAFVVGVLVTPPILNSVGGASAGSAMDGAVIATDYSAEVAPDTLVRGVPEIGATVDMDAAAASMPTDGREIVASAFATVEVSDIATAVDQITAIAEASGGYVESTDIGENSVMGASYPAPVDPGYGWISIRVPSADLAATIDALADSGEVVSSSISQQDVTSTAIDLRARVEATEASVQRLTELMAQTGSVAELIEAEVALTDRQAQLESYQQQLDALEDQVAMSSVQVQLTTPQAATTADPAGFGDGFLAGWNGLVVSLNALVIAVGFILPWLAVAGVIVLIVWSIRRARRSARERRAAEALAPAAEEPSAQD